MARRSALFGAFVGPIVIGIAACGGVAKVEGRGDQISESSGGAPESEAGTGGWHSTPAVGNGGSPGAAGAPAGGSNVATGVAAGGTRGGAGGVPTAANDAGTSGGRGGTGTAGTGGFATGGSPPKPPRTADGGPGCRNVFEAQAWPNACDALTECVDLKPSAWSPVTDAPSTADSGVSSRLQVIEAPFCEAPAKRSYMFAFDESGARYDAFRIVTGDDECEGYSLGYIGIGGIGDEPLAARRTHCFSVDGELLGPRLSIMTDDPDAVLSNLRAVSSCPCAYPIPYNVNTCPGVEGAAGHPNCG